MRIIQRDAKLEILNNSWSKVLALIYDESNKTKDKKLREIALAIPLIAPEVQKAALLEYLRKC